MSKQPMKNLVKCGDHGLAPGGVVCRHLLNRTATTWVAVKDVCPGLGPESDYDHLCPACVERFNDLGVDDLVTLCMHCIRNLQQSA